MARRDVAGGCDVAVHHPPEGGRSVSCGIQICRSTPSGMLVSKKVIFFVLVGITVSYLVESIS